MFNIQTGVNIGTHHIEVVQVKKTLAGYQLLNYGLVDIEKKEISELVTESSTEMVRELRRSQITEALRKVFEDNKIEPINVVTCIPDNSIVLRYFTMPYLPPKERNSAVKFEAQKYIPFKIDEVISDFIIVDAKDKRKELKVVFVATKREALNNYSNIFKDAAIPITAVEVPSLSILRLCNCMGLIKKKSTVAILNVQKTEAVLTICDNNTLYLMRDFSYSPELKKSGIPNIEPPAIEENKDLESAYENLLQEIQMSFDYHYKHFPHIKIEKLIVLGRNNPEQWNDELGKDLKMPVVICDPNVLFKGKFGLDSSMSIACGLALRGLKAGEKQINFSKGEMPSIKSDQEKERNFLLRIGAMELILGLSVMLLVSLTMNKQMRIMDTNLSEVRKTRLKFGENFSNLDKKELLRLQTGIVRKNSILNGMINKRIYLTTQLSKLPRLLPSGVWLESLQIYSFTDENSGRKIVKLLLDGKVFSADKNKTELALINELIANIKDDLIFSSEFNKIELGSMEKIEEKGFSVTKFRISCSG